MVQRLKDDVRTDIVRAATALFAEEGYAETSIAAVAKRAGVSTGNVYRYYASKELLFAAAVPEEFATLLEKKTRARIEALHSVRNIDSLAKDAPYHVLAEDILETSIANRERVVILLARGDGTPFEDFSARFRKKLVDWAIGYVRVTWPSIDVTPRLRFVLDRVYAGFLASLAETLATYREPEVIREVVALVSAHHLGGLSRLFEQCKGEAHG